MDGKFLFYNEGVEVTSPTLGGSRGNSIISIISPSNEEPSGTRDMDVTSSQEEITRLGDGDEGEEYDIRIVNQDSIIERDDDSNGDVKVADNLHPEVKMGTKKVDQEAVVVKDYGSNCKFGFDDSLQSTFNPMNSPRHAIHEIKINAFDVPKLDQRKHDHRPLYQLNPADYSHDPKYVARIRRAIAAFRHHERARQLVANLMQENKELRARANALRTKVLEMKNCGCERSKKVCHNILDKKIHQLPPRQSPNHDRKSVFIEDHSHVKAPPMSSINFLKMPPATVKQTNFACANIQFDIDGSYPQELMPQPPVKINQKLPLHPVATNVRLNHKMVPRATDAVVVKVTPLTMPVSVDEANRIQVVTPSTVVYSKANNSESDRKIEPLTASQLFFRSQRQQGTKFSSYEQKADTGRAPQILPMSQAAPLQMLTIPERSYHFYHHDPSETMTGMFEPIALQPTPVKQQNFQHAGIAEGVRIKREVFVDQQGVPILFPFFPSTYQVNNLLAPQQHGDVFSDHTTLPTDANDKPFDFSKYEDLIFETID